MEIRHEIYYDGPTLHYFDAVEDLKQPRVTLRPKYSLRITLAPTQKVLATASVAG